MSNESLHNSHVLNHPFAVLPQDKPMKMNPVDSEISLSEKLAVVALDVPRQSVKLDQINRYNAHHPLRLVLRYFVNQRFKIQRAYYIKRFKALINALRLAHQYLVNQRLKIQPQRFEALINALRVVNRYFVNRRLKIQETEDEQTRERLKQPVWEIQAIRSMSTCPSPMSADNIKIWIEHIRGARIRQYPPETVELLDRIIDVMIPYWNGLRAGILSRAGMKDTGGNVLRFNGSNPLSAPTQFLLLVPIIDVEDFDKNNYTCGMLSRKGLYEAIVDKEASLINRHSHKHSCKRGDPDTPTGGRFGTCPAELVQLLDDIYTFILDIRALLLPHSRHIIFGKPNERFVEDWRRDCLRQEFEDTAIRSSYESNLLTWTITKRDVERVLERINVASPTFASEDSQYMMSFVGQTTSFSYNFLHHPSWFAWGHFEDEKYRQGLVTDLLLNSVLLQLGSRVPSSAQENFRATAGDVHYGRPMRSAERTLDKRLGWILEKLVQEVESFAEDRTSWNGDDLSSSNLESSTVAGET